MWVEVLSSAVSLQMFRQEVFNVINFDSFGQLKKYLLVLEEIHLGQLLIT